jgi:hypothetical protein
MKNNNKIGVMLTVGDTSTMLFGSTYHSPTYSYWTPTGFLTNINYIKWPGHAVVGGGAALCLPFVGCHDAPALPFVGASVVGVVGCVRGWWGVGPSSPLRGGGGGPLSPFTGGGDVPLLGHCHCGWGLCSSLGGYDAGPSLAVVVGPILLRCPLPFSLHCPLPFSCRCCVVSSMGAVFVVPLRLCTPSPSLSVVKERQRGTMTSSHRSSSRLVTMSPQRGTRF